MGLKCLCYDCQAAVEAGKTAEAMNLLYGESRAKYDQSNETLAKFFEYNTDEASLLIKANQQAYETSRATSVAVLIVALILGFGLAIYIANGISRPAALVAQTALRVAEGNLTVATLQVKTQDEIGDMAKAFNNMVENLRNMVREISSTSQSVAATSEEMSATAEEATSATTNVENAIQQVAKGSTEQSKGISDTVQVMEQVASSIEQIAAGAQDQSRDAMETTNLVNDMVAKMDSMAESIQIVKQVSEQNGVVASNGGQDVEKTVNGMLNVKKAVFETAQRIQDLGVQSQKIGEIIQVIDDIAEQTSLLALNAAISILFSTISWDGSRFAESSQPVQVIGGGTMAEQQYVIFQLGNETFGVDIAKVWEIITLKAITKVPQAATFIEGIINLRGKVIPVIDLRARFGLPVREQQRSERIVVIEIEGNTLGMVVDGVSEVLHINLDQVEAPPPAVTNVASDYLAGVAKLEERLIILLNLDKVLNSDEQSELQVARTEAKGIRQE